MKTISTDELKAKLDRGDEFKLVMAFDDWRYQAAHIPGSMGIGTPAAAEEALRVSEEIVVYCLSIDCTASQVLHRALLERGYENVVRYAEGVLGWQEAGHPLEGDRLG